MELIIEQCHTSSKYVSPIILISPHILNPPPYTKVFSVAKKDCFFVAKSIQCLTWLLYDCKTKSIVHMSLQN